MHIYAYGKGFGLPAMMDHGNFHYEANGDGSLSFWTSEGNAYVSAWAAPGVFLEVLNEGGEIVKEGGDLRDLWIEASESPLKLRYKKLPNPKLSKSELDSQRNTVTRTLVSDMPHSLGIPDTVSGAIEWLRERLAEVPEGCQESAEVSFDTEMSYGETYPNCRITYRQPETDKEVIQRIQVSRETLRLEERRERAKLEQLKAKFEAAK